ncbi:MAG TPA: hypothetical protein VFF52_03225 [Isosphaeraceae bacterium]|nr:hypothetical protein [Isosphaeraceae bacterium]
MLPTLVFVFNGNAFAEAKPAAWTTGLAAEQLDRHGDRAIQLTTPAMDSPAAFYQLAGEVRRLSRGEPIGLMGFSAGGALAMRLAGLPGLNVKAVMNYYGPPDFRDWLAYHRGDRFFQHVLTHVQVTPGFVRLMSGPSATQAYIVSAFGLRDQTVVSSVSTASFDRDFQHGQVYDYPGPHGVTLYACYPAFQDFLAHL